MNDDIPELAAHDFSRALSSRTRQRLISGDFHGGKDIQALRRFIALSQSEFAEALGISVHTLRNWEQDRRRPEGPALALLSVAARNPRVLRERVRPAARTTDAFRLTEPVPEVGVALRAKVTEISARQLQRERKEDGMSDHTITYFPVGNGDTSLIKLADKTTFVIDLNVTESASDEEDPSRYDVHAHFL